MNEFGEYVNEINEYGEYLDTTPTDWYEPVDTLEWHEMGQA